MIINLNGISVNDSEKSHTGPAQELALAAKKAGTELDTLCPDCRQKRMADVLSLA